MRRAATERFKAGLVRAVAHLGGDRAAEQISGVGKAVWYDAKSGRAVPDDRTTWPAMLAVLTTLPVSVTGVGNWADLYALMRTERGRSPGRQRASPGLEKPRRSLVPRQLPPGTTPFVARRGESEVLDEVLTAPAETTPIAVLTGLPGVGKTSLAVDWAHRVADRFPDGVLYTDLRGWSPDPPLEPQEVLPAWLRALGMDPVFVSDDLPGQAAALRSVLDGRRVLIILDNARSEEQVRLLLPGSATCAVLVTSRQTLEGLAVHHGARVVTLEPLSPAVSAGLLEEIAGPRISSSARTLARLCGHLPLALRVVAESARGRTPEEIAELQVELAGPDLLDRLSTGDPRTDVRMILSWSFGRLPDDARRIFALLGLLPGRTFDVSAVASLAGIAPRAAATRLRTMVRAQLIQPRAGGRFEMHDLVAAFAAELAAESADHGARIRLYRYYLHAARRADALIAPHRYQLPLVEEGPMGIPFDDYEGALRWFDVECRTMTTLCLPDGESPSNAEAEIDGLRWRLAFLLKSYFYLSRKTHEWIVSHRAALAAAIRTGERTGEAVTLHNLGIAYYMNGDGDRALSYYESAERIFAQVGDRHGVSNAIASQAVAHRRRGDLDLALRLNERALTFYREAARTHPDSRRYIAITLHSIGLVEMDFGRYADAERYLREALELCVDLDMGMDLARTWNALGAVLAASGRPAEALEAYQSGVEAALTCGSRFEEATAWHGLGAVAAALDDVGLAERYLRNALELFTTLGSARAGEVLRDLAGLSVHGSR